MTKQIVKLIAIGVAAALLVWVVFLLGRTSLAPNLGGKQINIQQSFNAGIAVDGIERISGTGVASFLESTEALTANNTLVVMETTKVSYVSGATSTQTLPALTDGVVFRFVVSGAVTGEIAIDSAEGDNIEGSLIVAGAVVDCAAEDQVNFIDTVENVGDYVELRSNGTNWFITASNALTSGAITCTDPS